MPHYIYSGTNEEIQQTQEHATRAFPYLPTYYFENLIFLETSKDLKSPRKLKILLRESTSDLQGAFTVTFQLNETDAHQVLHRRYIFVEPGLCIKQLEKKPEQIKMALVKVPHAAELFMQKMLADFPPEKYTFLEAPKALASNKYLEIGLQTENKIQSLYCSFFPAKPKPTPLLPAAVLSIQTLDQQKVALSPKEVETYFATHQLSLLSPGDGHTGFAIAKVLQAPYVVMRSTENRALQNRVLTGHIVNNGLLIVTGHSIPSKDIFGLYDGVFHNNTEVNFQKQIERGPSDVVQSSMGAGLPAGSHLTIVLCICYGAQNKVHEDGYEEMNSSFAYRLAQEFAAQGISTTIIASDKPVLRFGTQAINNTTLSFNEHRGIAPQDICIFKTTLLNQNIEIKKYKPLNLSITLSKEGLQFTEKTDLASLFTISTI